MKKISIVILSILLFSRCAMLGDLLMPSDPVLRINGLSFHSLDFEKVSLRLDTTILNPYAVRLPSSRIKAAMALDGSSFAEVESDPVSVPARNSADTYMYLHIPHQRLASLFHGITERESIKLGLNGGIEFPLNLPGLPDKISLPLSIERDVPVIIPEIAVENFEVEKPGTMDLLGGIITGNPSVGASFDVVLRNRARAALSLSGLDYQMNLNGNPFIEGRSQQVVSTPEMQGRESVARIRTSIPLREIPDLVNTLQRGRAAFDLTGNSSLQFPGFRDLGNLDFGFKEQGNVSW